MDEFCLCVSSVCVCVCVCVCARARARLCMRVCSRDFLMQLAVAGWDSSCCVGRAINVYDTCLCVSGRDFMMQLAMAGGDNICSVCRAIYVYDTCPCVCGRDFLMQLAMEGGDSNSNCCVGGAILGLRTGYQRLPTDWIQGLRAKQLSWLNFRINHLLDMMGLP